MSAHRDPHPLLPPLDDQPGPARRLPRERAAAMVDAALDAASLPEREPAPHEDRRREASAPRGRRLRLFLAAALVLFVAGGASAGVYVWKTQIAPPAPEPEVAEPNPRPPAEPRPAPAVEPEPEPAPPIEMEPERVAPPVQKRRAIDTGPADAPVEDLLRLANERRRDRRWRAADAIYRRVMREHRGERAGYVAALASADLRLRHLGQPRAALVVYRTALERNPTGPLAEEARWGIVEAVRALGDADAERRALRAFLDHHPDSPRAARARARLDRTDSDPAP